jgi:hypothetical protein
LLSVMMPAIMGETNPLTVLNVLLMPISVPA